MAYVFAGISVLLFLIAAGLNVKHWNRFSEQRRKETRVLGIAVLFLTGFLVVISFSMIGIMKRVEADIAAFEAAVKQLPPECPDPRKVNAMVCLERDKDGKPLLETRLQLSHAEHAAEPLEFRVRIKDGKFVLEPVEEK
jgi:hypothetical protein